MAKYRFTSKELDPDFVAFNSENRRYHFLARAYRPFLGAFTQLDQGSDVHPYAAMRSNPLQFVDPSGGSSVKSLPPPQTLEEFLEEAIKRAFGVDELPKDYPKECLPETLELETFKAYPIEEITHGGLRRILDDIRSEAEERCRQHCRFLPCFNWPLWEWQFCYYCSLQGIRDLRLLERPVREFEGGIRGVGVVRRGGAMKVEDFGDAAIKDFTTYIYTVRCMCECKYLEGGKHL